MTTMSLAQAAKQLLQHDVELTPDGNTALPAKDAVDISFFYRYVRKALRVLLTICCTAAVSV